MDKLVETVRQEAERMRLAHEIAVNADFKLEQVLKKRLYCKYCFMALRNSCETTRTQILRASVQLLISISRYQCKQS